MCLKIIDLPTYLSNSIYLSIYLSVYLPMTDNSYLHNIFFGRAIDDVHFHLRNRRNSQAARVFTVEAPLLRRGPAGTIKMGHDGTAAGGCEPNSSFLQSYAHFT